MGAKKAKYYKKPKNWEQAGVSFTAIAKYLKFLQSNIKVVDWSKVPHKPGTGEGGGTANPGWPPK